MSEFEFSGEAAITAAPAQSAWPARAGEWVRTAVTVPRILLALIVVGAATGYAWSLDTAGLETFYAAGVRSMSGSWHAFFYDAFDPRASVTLDKLPGAFWIQALSVRCFGLSVWAMVLPQILESTLTVLVLYRAVRRTAGTAAALTAAAMLAASPITIASTRGNLAEPLYLLCTVLAADATLRAVTTGRTRSWYVAAVWVAVGFQAKMTEAWLVLPILGLVLILAAPAGRLRVALRAGLGVLLAAALSLVWMLCFTLTPAADRPYADGSKGNSIFQQVFDYNGVLRFDSSPTRGFPPLAAPSPQAEAISVDNRRQGSTLYPPVEVTRPGWDRLLTDPAAPDCDWFLLLAVGGAAATFASRRRAGRGDPVRAATLLWSAWLLGYGVAFSAAHFIQGYYLATLIPAAAAAAGTGLWVLWRAARAGSRRAGTALGVLVAGQAAWSGWLVHGTYAFLSWLILAAAVAALLVGATVQYVRGRVPRPGGSGRRARLTRRATVVLGAAAVLTGPLAAATWLEARAGGPFDVAFSAQGTLAQPTPAALIARSQVKGVYGGSIHPQYLGGQWAGYMSEGAADQHRLSARHADELVFSSAAAAGYVLYGATSIVAVGGFSGDAPYPTVDQVRGLIESGTIAFAVVPDADVLTANDPRVKAVEQLCTEFEDGFSTGGYLVYTCGTSTAH